MKKRKIPSVVLAVLGVVALIGGPFLILMGADDAACLYLGFAISVLGGTVLYLLVRTKKILSVVFTVLAAMILIIGISLIFIGIDDGEWLFPGFAMSALGGLVLCLPIATRKHKEAPVPKPTKPAPEPEPTPEPPKPIPPKPPNSMGKFCRHCGAKVEPDDIYCVECGNTVS